MNDKQKHSIELSVKTESIIIGMILSDARLQMNGKYGRITIEQKDKIFVYYLWEVFNKEGVVRAKPVKRIKDSNYYSYRFNSISLPYFSNLYKLWYKKEKTNNISGYKNIKILPKEYLIEKFNILVLIFMIAGDGYYDKHNGFIGICTESFTKDENIFLISIIKKNTNINCSLMEYKNKYRIRINKQETKKLIDVIKNQIPAGMEYKFGV